MSALGSTSTPYPIMRYRWNCGQAGNPDCMKEGITPSFSYIRDGFNGMTFMYTVTLTVEDDHGNQNTATERVTVVQRY
jgi:hypothetical protein